MTTCSVCNDYLLQLRQAKARHDDDNYQRVKALYVEHLNTEHQTGKQKPAMTRNAVRQAFGKWGD